MDGRRKRKGKDMVIKDLETIPQMIVRMRIELVEQLITQKIEEIRLDELKLEDPNYNKFFIQHGISYSKGYLQGLKNHLESLTEIQKTLRQ